MKNFLLFCLIVCTQCAWEWPNGWDLGPIKPTAINYPGAPATTNTTLVVGQSGNILVFNGVSLDTKFFLPTAVPGLDFAVIDDTTNFIAMIPQSTDKINIASTITGQGIHNATSAAIGNAIELYCATAGIWSVRDQSGTWTTGN